MTDESKDAADDVPIVVETVWDVVDRFTQDDGRSGWTCPGCKNKFFGVNATKAKAHILRLGGFSVLPCHSWRDINQKKLELLAELHYKKEKESDAKKQKKEQDAAGIEAANTSAGNLLSASARRSSGSIGSAGGGAASRLPYTPSATSAFSSQTSSALTMAVADFIHAEGLPFRLSESPRLALIIKLAKSAPIAYKPPHRHAVSGSLLDLNYTQAKSKTMSRLGKDADVYGASLFSDGATAKHVPLLNYLGASAVCPPVMLEILDCRDHMTAGGKKDAPYIANQTLTQIGAIGRSKVDLFFIDGASNMQVAGAILTLKVPTITCVHAAEHVAALVFSDIAKIPAVQKLIRGQQRLYRHFTAVHMAPSMLEKKSKSFNSGRALGPDRAAGSRMASYFYGFHKDLRLKASYQASVTDPAYIDAKPKNGSLITRVVNDEFRWKQVYLLLLMVWPLLKLLRLADSHTPSMSKVRTARHVRILHLTPPPPPPPPPGARAGSALCRARRRRSRQDACRAARDR